MILSPSPPPFWQKEFDVWVYCFFAFVFDLALILFYFILDFLVDLLLSLHVCLLYCILFSLQQRFSGLYATCLVDLNYVILYA